MTFRSDIPAGMKAVLLLTCLSACAPSPSSRESRTAPPRRIARDDEETHANVLDANAILSHRTLYLPVARGSLVECVVFMLIPPPAGEKGPALLERRGTDQHGPFLVRYAMAVRPDSVVFLKGDIVYQNGDKGGLGLASPLLVVDHQSDAHITWRDDSGAASITGHPAAGRRETWYFSPKACERFGRADNATLL